MRGPCVSGVMDERHKLPSEAIVELKGLPDLVFARTWVPIILDAIEDDSASLKDLALMLAVVRERYEVERISRSGRRPKSHKCTECGVPVHNTAKRCSECHRRRQLAQRICLDCGGLMASSKAKRCQACHERLTYKNKPCVDCGGLTANARSARCKACYLKKARKKQPC